MKNAFWSWVMIAGLFLPVSLVAKAGAPLPQLKNGIWHGSIQRPDGRQLVFNFEVRDSTGRKIILVRNDTERLLVDAIKQVDDSIAIDMPFFDSRFIARLTGEGNLEGFWIRKLANEDQRMPFKAIYNKKERFESTLPPSINITGRWSVAFSARNNVVTWAVGEFVQKGNYLAGTFLTSAGDYRFLEGIVSGDSLKLSTFDGGHAYLFTARAHSDTLLSGGYFYSGFAGLQKWTARKDPNAALPDGYSETKLKTGQSMLDFRFKSIEGKMVSIKDPAYKNKVVVVQLMGSWCPNCMDETAFLSNYYNTQRPRNVEVIALAYEVSTDFRRSVASIRKFQKRFNIRYPTLVTGVAVSDSALTQKTLPQLTNIVAFPTSIFIDKKGIVRKIYSGFNGPGTGEHYALFKKEFYQTIDELLAE